MIIIWIHHAASKMFVTLTIVGTIISKYELTKIFPHILMLFFWKGYKKVIFIILSIQIYSFSHKALITVKLSLLASIPISFGMVLFSRWTDGKLSKFSTLLSFTGNNSIKENHRHFYFELIWMNAVLNMVIFFIIFIQTWKVTSLAVFVVTCFIYTFKFNK